MTEMTELLAEHLCEFDDGDTCENCKAEIPPGQPIYFFSDGGYDCREGTYRCETCARDLLTDHGAATA